MEQFRVICAGSTGASRHAAEYLTGLGVKVSDAPADNATHLLLDVPAFQKNGTLRGGGDLPELLRQLPGNITVCGGNLEHPALAGYRTADFLKDETYLCENAYITAECALDTALPYLSRTLRRCPVLIIGWGRIGKCLGLLLKNLGAEVTIAARNSAHRAMIHALGYGALNPESITDYLNHFRLLYNTVPCPVLDREQLLLCREDCVKIELASRDGIIGDDIVVARGLPGLHMPESSGELIAQTFLRLC